MPKNTQTFVHNKLFQSQERNIVLFTCKVRTKKVVLNLIIVDNYVGSTNNVPIHNNTTAAQIYTLSTSDYSACNAVSSAPVFAQQQPPSKIHLQTVPSQQFSNDFAAPAIVSTDAVVWPNQGVSNFAPQQFSEPQARHDGQSWMLDPG